MKKFKKQKLWFIATYILLLLIAFVQSYKTTHDLHWAFDPDFDRDMAFIQGMLDGNFGKDPNYKGEYMWYNPLLFSIETAIVKITGLPINTVLARAGVYLNILSPVAFFIMLLVFFDYRIALGSLVSYLFLASGDLLSWASPTYAPWLYPNCFIQFIFYLNIILCYKAFSTEKYFWFFILGISTGISFLGHTAPTILIILIIFSIQFRKICISLKARMYWALLNYLLQGLLTFISFLIISFPLLFYIIGKYNLAIVNRIPFEYLEGIFIPINFLNLIKENISVFLLVSVIGFLSFYRKIRNYLLRKIVFNWLFISLALFLYATLIPIVRNKYGILLPGTVPSSHYFFYLKALQSVFFGIGFVILFDLLFLPVEYFIYNKLRKKVKYSFGNKLYLISLFLLVIIYHPFYKNRMDFVYLREQAIVKENDKDKIEVYDWIMKNIPADQVILCENKLSIFPVMPTARKMVAINVTFSNPYLDFEKRDEDRNNMLSFLKSGQPDSVRKLFHDYEVNAVLLKNEELKNYKMISSLFSLVRFKNNSYTLFEKL